MLSPLRERKDKEQQIATKSKKEQKRATKSKKEQLQYGKHFRKEAITNKIKTKRLRGQLLVSQTWKIDYFMGSNREKSTIAKLEEPIFFSPTVPVYIQYIDTRLDYNRHDL